MKKLLLVAIFFLAAPHTFAAQAIFQGSTGNLSPTAEQYLPISGYNFMNGLDSGAGLISATGTVSTMFVHLATAPGAGTSRVATILKNEASTTVTCTIADALKDCTALNFNIPVIPGDRIVLAMMPVNTPANTTFGTSIVFVPQILGDMVISMRQNNTYSTTLEQFTPIDQSNVVAPSGIEASTTQLIPTAGTIDKLYVTLNNNPAGAASYTHSLRDNFASTTLSATIAAAATTGSDTANTVAVALGDLVDFAVVPAGGPTARRSGTGVRFHAVDGVTSSIFMGSSLSGFDVNNANRFVPISGDRTVTATEANAQVPAPMNMTITNIVASSTAAGAGNTRTFTLRVNGISTSLSCTLSGTASTCTGVGNVRVRVGDLLSTLDSSSASAANGSPMVSYSAMGPYGKVTVNGRLTLGYTAGASTITLDKGGYQETDGATSATMPFTVAAGSNRLLVVNFLINGDGTPQPDDITGVTYNGVAMTQDLTASALPTSLRNYSYHLVAPATGANNIVISSSASINYFIFAASFAGAAQTGTIPEQTAVNSTFTGTTNFTNAVTTVTNNAVHVALIYNTSGGSITQSAGTGTQKITGTDNGVNSGALWWGSPTAVSPAGSNTLTATQSSNATGSSIGASYAPAPGVTTGGILTI